MVATETLAKRQGINIFPFCSEMVDGNNHLLSDCFHVHADIDTELYWRHNMDGQLVQFVGG